MKPSCMATSAELWIASVIILDACGRAVPWYLWALLIADTLLLLIRGRQP
jgi:hypothetical protein